MMVTYLFALAAGPDPLDVVVGWPGVHHDGDDGEDGAETGFW